MKIFNKLDIIIILALLLLSIFLIFKPYGYSTKKLLLVIERDSFYIPYKDGKINLSEKVKDVFGNLHDVYKDMEFEVVDGRVRAVYSNCTNQICVKSTWKKNCGESVVCAPNRVALIIDCSDINLSKK